MLIADDRAATDPAPLWDAAVNQLISGPPGWFPYGVKVVSQWQIPCLKAPQIDTVPTRAMAFDKRSQAADIRQTLLHAYVADEKLRSQLVRPQVWVNRFSGFWGVVAPDFSIRADAPPDQRVFAVRMSRSVGAFYQSHGLRVIPNVRWGDHRDFDYCFLGVEPGSAVAVSNHGCWRSTSLRQGFLAGLHEMVERLAPSLVFLHGTMNHPAFRRLSWRTEFIHLKSDRTLAGTEAA